MQTKRTARQNTMWLCTTAVLMAMNVAFSSFGVPVAGGHLYLNDIVICTAAIILDPLAAFMVGGVGAFLGDLFFYPTPDVGFTYNTRLASNSHFRFLTLCFEKETRAQLGNRRRCRRSNNDCRLFNRQSIFLRHSRGGNIKASVPDSSGGCRRSVRYAPLLEIRHT